MTDYSKLSDDELIALAEREGIKVVRPKPLSDELIDIGKSQAKNFLSLGYGAGEALAAPAMTPKLGETAYRAISSGLKGENRGLGFLGSIAKAYGESKTPGTLAELLSAGQAPITALLEKKSLGEAYRQHLNEQKAYEESIDPFSRLVGTLAVPAAGALEATAPKVAGSLKQVSAKTAAQSPTLTPGEISSLGRKKMREMGELLNKEKITNAGKTLEKMATETSQLRKRLGSSLESMYSRADELFKYPLSKTHVQNKILESMTKVGGVVDKTVPQSAVKSMSGILDDAFSGFSSTDKIKPSELWKVAKKLDDKSGEYRKVADIPDNLAKADLCRDASHAIRKITGDIIENTKGSGNLANEIRETGREYGLATEAHWGFQRQVDATWKKSTMTPGGLASKLLNATINSMPARGLATKTMEKAGTFFGSIPRSNLLNKFQ